MDFTQPVDFGNGVFVRPHNDDMDLQVVPLASSDTEKSDNNIEVDKDLSTSIGDQEVEKEGRKSDNDSGFGTDEFRSSFDMPETTTTDTAATKAVSGISKYIPPKLRFTRSNQGQDGEESEESTVRRPVSPIPIPSKTRVRRYQASHRVKDSFDDSTGSMPSSFGGHGINVGAFAYQRRPFAPAPAVWRNQGQAKNASTAIYQHPHHPNHQHIPPPSQSSVSPPQIPSGSMRKKASKDILSDRDRDFGSWRQQSPPNRPRAASPPPSSLQIVGSPPKNSIIPATASNSTPVKLGHRKRSSTVGGTDPIKLFNGPMPGMTNFQHANRSLVSLSSSLTGEKAAVTPRPPTPPKPSSEKTKQIPSPLSHTNPVDEPLTFAETGLRTEVLISPASSEEGFSIETPQDQNTLKVVPKNTMTELGRLLRSIVGYNRNVKVGGEGKD